jgi:hypothetical protein
LLNSLLLLRVTEACVWSWLGCRYSGATRVAALALPRAAARFDAGVPYFAAQLGRAAFMYALARPARAITGSLRRYNDDRGLYLSVVVEDY